MTLWLVGMMGSGKTAAGKLASERLGVAFYDTDADVASRMGCSVARLWEELGEPAFREMEKASIRRLTGEVGIVATGGGAVIDPDNREAMRSSGEVVWLAASPRSLARRLGGVEGRPLLDGPATPEVALGALLSRRSGFYREASSAMIDTEGLSVESVADEIARIWKS